MGRPSEVLLVMAFWNRDDQGLSLWLPYPGIRPLSAYPMGHVREIERACAVGDNINVMIRRRYRHADRSHVGAGAGRPLAAGCH